VISTSVRKNLIKQGKEEKYVHITGNPAFDPFTAASSLKEITFMKKRLSINEHQKVIIYTPSPEGDRHIYTGQPTDPLLPEKILYHLLSVIKERKDLFLIIRPHPSQEFKVSSLPENTFYDEGNDLKIMLSISDLVVTLGSTVGIQAQLLGKRIICCNQSIYANDTLYEDFGPVKRIYSMNNIEHIIDQELQRAIQTPKASHEEKILAVEKACNLIEHLL
jgi:predicted glycosyltransferase